MRIALRWGTLLSANLRKSSNERDLVFTREYLVKLREKAVRRGCWFGCLAHGERKLLELTIRVVEKVRSFLLTKIVSKLVSTLVDAMESRVSRLIRTQGKEMAKRLSAVAVSLGHRTAKKWVRDKGLVQFLVINNLGEFDK